MVAGCPFASTFCGMKAGRLVRELAGNCSVDDKLRFKSYVPGPGVAERLGIKNERSFFSKSVRGLLRGQSDAATLVGKIKGGPTTDKDAHPRFFCVSAADVRA